MQTVFAQEKQLFAQQMPRFSLFYRKNGEKRQNRPSSDLFAAVFALFSLGFLAIPTRHTPYRARDNDLKLQLLSKTSLAGSLKSLSLSDEVRL